MSPVQVEKFVALYDDEVDKKRTGPNWLENCF